MSKYRPLSDRLQGHADDEWRTSFADIEAMLGFPLPKGARSGRAWWEKTAPEGWEVGEVRQGEGVVTFRRSAISPIALEQAAGLAPVGDLSAEAPRQAPTANPPAVAQPPAMREAAESASRSMHHHRKLGAAVIAAGVAAVGVGLGMAFGLLKGRR